MTKINPKWIRDEIPGMTQEAFSLVTGIPLLDVMDLEAGKRGMTDLEEKMFDAWRGGYKPAQVEQAIKTVQSLRATLTPGTGGVKAKHPDLFRKHYGRLRYDVDRERRMSKDRAKSREGEVRRLDELARTYYQRQPEAFALDDDL